LIVVTNWAVDSISRTSRRCRGLPDSRVMAALTQLLLGDRAGAFFQQPVNAGYYLREFFFAVPWQTQFAILNHAESWPEPQSCPIQDEPGEQADSNTR